MLRKCYPYTPFDQVGMGEGGLVQIISFEEGVVGGFSSGIQSQRQHPYLHDLYEPL